MKENNQFEETVMIKNNLPVAESSIVRVSEEAEWDEFGNDLYTIPDMLPQQSSRQLQAAVPPHSRADEDSKIKALIDTFALDWQRQTQEFGSGRGFGRGLGGRMMTGRGFGRGAGPDKKTPPQSYICYRCKIPGHFCPNNSDPNYDLKRVKPPTGIPKSMLMATQEGSYALPSGAVAVLKPNEAAFEKEIEGIPSTKPVGDLPPELHCPLCKKVMKDAVLTSKCCFNGFCDKCIRDYIISRFMCVCGATNILADDLLPNETLRETISRSLESTTSNGENGGSLQVQGMESARFPLPKVPSPTLSATAKEGQILPPQSEGGSMKEAVSEGKAAVSAPQLSMESRATKQPDASEATLGSPSVKEQIFQGSAPVAVEEVQQKLPSGERGKKKKKKKVCAPNDMQGRMPQDLAAESFAMPICPSTYKHITHTGAECSGEWMATWRLMVIPCRTWVYHQIHLRFPLELGCGDRDT